MAFGVELGDQAVTGVSDVNVASGNDARIVDGKKVRRFEATGGGRRGAGLAFVTGGGRADVLLRFGGGGFDLGLVDFLAEHEDELAGGVELLDAVITRIGDVEIVAGLIDFNFGWPRKRIGAGAGNGRGESMADAGSRGGDVEEHHHPDGQDAGGG